MANGVWQPLFFLRKTPAPGKRRAQAKRKANRRACRFLLKG